MWRRLPFFLWLIALWMLLWGQFTVLAAVTGLVVALFVTRVFRLPPVELSGRVNLWYGAAFVVMFFFAVLRGSLLVAWQTVNLARYPGTAIIAVPLRTDDDLRWSALIRASALGGVDADRIEAAAEVDPTVSGRQHRLTALAAMPDAKAKEMSWLEMTTDRTLSAHEAMAIARGLWLGDPPLADALADRWLVDVPTMSSWMRDDALARLATASFPADRVDGAFRGQVAQAAARDDLSAGIRRVLIDQGARLDEALASL